MDVLCRQLMTKWTQNGTIYWGRDYEAINTIFTHMNARLKILRVNDLLEDGEINPWVNSNYHTNRTEIMKRIITKNKISVILQSQSFTEDNDLLEHAYPHAQDDDCIITKKSKEVEFHVQLKEIVDIKARILNHSVAFGKWQIILVNLAPFSTFRNIGTTNRNSNNPQETNRRQTHLRSATSTNYEQFHSDPENTSRTFDTPRLAYLLLSNEPLRSK